MIERIRAVLDTNVFISALLSKSQRSPAKELLGRWRNQAFILIVCEAQMNELIAKLLQFHIPEHLIIRLIADIELLAGSHHLDIQHIPRIIPDDPDDDVMIACAIQSYADFLVTNDRHFDALGGFYRHVHIIDTLHFLWTVRGDSPPPQ